MCASVNLNVHNFNSNSNKNVLEAMAIKDRYGDLKDLNFPHDVLTLDLQNLCKKDGMFQNRQNTYNRNEKMKLTL